MRYSRIPAGVGAVLCVASACGERAPAVDTARRDTASAAGLAALPAAAGRCDAPSAGAVRVSDDSIAYLGADATMGELRARCPAAGDTVNAAEHGTNPALVFRFDGASALVWQNGPVLDLARSADGWTVSGPAVRIADSIPLTAPWATIRRAMGDSATAAVALQANGQPDRGSVVVRFCAHPLVDLMIVV